VRPLSHGRARLVAAALVCLLAVSALALLLTSSNRDRFARHGVALRQRAVAFGDREPGRGSEQTDGPAAQQVGDRAWPRSYVTTSRAMAARRAVTSKPQRLSSSDFRTSSRSRAIVTSAALTTAWTELGPTTPHVPGDVTYTGRPTLNSGRITALAISPTCTSGDCRLWVGAAGGGVWRTDDALAATPTWTSTSSGRARSRRWSARRR